MPGMTPGISVFVLSRKNIPGTMILGATSRRPLQRFHNCYFSNPLLLSGIFLKKMPP
jgi:hypothetical protein